MKRHRVYYLFMLIVVALAMSTSSCSQESLNDPVPENSQKATEARIRTLLEQFYASVHPETRGSSRPFNISAIESRSFSMHDLLQAENIGTRSEDVQDFSLHTVTLEFPDASGFAIVSDDPRIDKVFFFTEHGEIGDTAFIAPLKDLVDSYPTLAAEMIADTTVNPNTRSSTSISFIDNILATEWGQGFPYNKCAPYCSCAVCSKRGNHQLTGCVTTAVAQYLVNRGAFNGTYYPNNNLDLSSFLTHWYTMTDLQQSYVANYYREIAHNCQIRFGCDGSGGQASAVVAYLKEIGITCELIQGDLTAESIYSELSKGIPHLISGTGSDGGHMWLITGIRPNGAGEAPDYYCNWGEDGSCNGWSVGNYYTPTTPLLHPFEKSIQHIYTYKW